MKSCVVRVSGPAVAKVSIPRLFDCVTGSSGILASRHTRFTAGSPLMPNWTMKFSITRKKATSSK
jgi:hypothetical protein